MSDAPIERFFEMYAERYMASDADAIAAMYEVPFLAVREGRSIHLGDAGAAREHLVGLMDAYRKLWCKAGDNRGSADHPDRPYECPRHAALARHW